MGELHPSGVEAGASGAFLVRSRQKHGRKKKRQVVSGRGGDKCGEKNRKGVGVTDIHSVKGGQNRAFKRSKFILWKRE